MSRKDNIIARLPHFYRSWDDSSSVYWIASSVGKRIDEAEKDLIAILRSHWVDTASGYDLDRLGKIYGLDRNAGESDPDYRGRIVTAIVSYKGGGTLGAIRMLMRIAINVDPDYPIEIIENPRAMMQGAWSVSASSRWTIDPQSVEESIPEVTIQVETDDAHITDPTLTNLTTGEKIVFRGTIGKGDVLKIADGRATLNGEDKTASLTSAHMPSLPREKTEWQYTESIGANIGVFDEGLFDRSVFTVNIVSRVLMEWNVRQPATFHLLLPRGLLSGSKVTLDFLNGVLGSIKTCGVKAEIKVV